MADDRRRKQPAHEQDTLGADELETASLGSPRSHSPGPPPPELEPGQSFGEYDLIRKLGQGGFGQVWEALDRGNGRLVAVKVLTQAPADSGELRERFAREGRLAAALNHPNCVYVFGADEVGGVPVIVMEMVDGGTLQDLVRQGPLPARRAVDYILDVIDGLEAAHAVGILHRDIKPSNCFLGQDGRAKVGDFGLSKTLEADVKLTVTGSFLGTPAYASPEQMRGRDVDHRTDLYSLGATLYSLLTGHPPFEAANAGEVLARILSEEPTPFADHGVDVHPGLQRVVLRLLRKEPEKRFQTYVELRGALLPFSSRGLAPATLWPRFLAVLADSLVLTAPNFLFGMMLGASAVAGVTRGSMLLQIVPATVLQILYYAISEGVWGRSPGKLVFGLRVVDTGGAPATAGRVLLRTLLFTFIGGGFGIVVYLFADRPVLVATLLNLLGIGALVSTMRRANGFAGLHELLSRTRVLSVRTSEAIRMPEAAPLELGPEPAGAGAYGPFRVVGSIWQADDQSLLLARDDVLERDVWIHRRPQPGPDESGFDPTVSRPGRLRWLQGGDEDGQRWDAWAAPDGISFLDLVSRRGRLHWAELRVVLDGLVAELEAAGDDPATRLCLTRLWVDAAGQVKLLDFPITADSEASQAGEDWQAFLATVTRTGLEGSIPDPAAAETDRRAPAAPLPESARSFVLRLCEERVFASPAEVVESLRVLLGQPARVSRWRRALTIAVAAVPALFAAVIMLSAVLVTSKIPQSMRALTRLGDYLETLRSIEAGDADQDPAPRQALLQLISAGSQRLEEMRGEDFVMVSSDLMELLDDPEATRIFQQAREAFPEPTEEELVAARRIVGEAFPELQRGKIKHFELMPAVAPMIASAALAIPAILLALILRGTLFFRLFGIAVQRSDGGPASRLRCTARSLVAWSPFLLTGVAVALPLAEPVTLGIILGLAPVALAGVVVAIVSSERGLAERITNTQLVPR